MTDCADPDCATDSECIDEVCGNGLDDDGDGFIDCDDPDCATSNTCMEGCQESINSPVLCGFSQQLNTGGGQSMATGYTCPFGGPDSPGKEVVYPFEVSTPTIVTALLSSGPGTGLYVLQDKGYGCTPKHCIQYGLASVQFQAMAGVMYYLVVDSTLDSSIPFSIEVNCL